MDTVELGSNSSELRQIIWRNANRLFRKHRKGLVDQSTGLKQYPRKNSPYYYQQDFAYGKIPFHISYSPKFRSLPHLKIVFHLSKFENYGSFLNLALPLCDGLEDDLLNMSVHRIDQCIDIEVPFETIRESILVKNVNSCYLMKNRGSAESLTLGKYPFQTICYEKTVPSNEVDLSVSDIFDHNKNDFSDIEDELKTVSKNSTTKSNCISKDVSRIEIRQWGKRLPIRHFREIFLLKDGRAFSHIQFNYPDLSLIRSLETRKLRTVQAFLYERDKKCLQMSKMDFSASAMSKTIKPNLKKIEVIDLDKGWGNRCRRWFGGANAYS